MRGPVVLPSPGVEFRPDFLARVGRLVARLASARERQEGAGSARLFGVGSEFVGYRPYRSGEDLRALDWNLLARLGRPYVRVAAREATEHWLVLLDTSASMGVGRPGKLQLGAEVATALAALGVAQRATVELRLASGQRCVMQKSTGLAGWMRVLASARAEGNAGVGPLALEAGRERRAGRVFVVGDLLDVEPAGVVALARRSRELYLAQLLAREELAPAQRGPVRWIGAESASAREVRVDESAATRYEARLGERIDAWRHAARCVRAVHGCWSSDAPFEGPTAGLCAAAG